MEFEDKLRKVGLTGNEAKVYLELLKRGSLSANDLAKKISMDRTLTYTVLNHLIEKGLVNYVIKQKKKFFEAADPDHLMNPVKLQEAFVKDLIPQLSKIEKIKEVIQEVNIYEGKEGLRTAMNQLAKAKSFVAFGATGRAYDMLYESPRIVKEMQKRGVKGKIIMNPKYKKHKMTKVKGLEVKYLDVKSEATTTIAGNLVNIHLLTQKPLIIQIKNKEIAESYRNHFNILWKAAT